MSRSSREPSVTVLMAVYNGQTYLEAAIESVLHQSWQDFEFLVIDDASTDESPAILAAYQERDPRLRVVRNETNIKLPASLNRGLSFARGRYIARMDADDISARNRLERQVAFLDTHPHHVLVGTGYRSIDEHCRVRYARPNPMHDPLAQFVTRFRIPMTHPGVCYRRLLPDGQPVVYSEAFPLAEDYQLISDLAAAGRIAVIDGTLIDYRVHSSNITSQNRPDVRRQHAAIARTNIERHYPAELATKLVALIETLYRLEPPTISSLVRSANALDNAVAHDASADRKLASLLRRRAAGFLAEAYLGEPVSLQFGLAFVARVPRFLVPFALRLAELRGWIRPVPGPTS